MLKFSKKVVAKQESYDIRMKGKYRKCVENRDTCLWPIQTHSFIQMSSESQ